LGQQLGSLGWTFFTLLYLEAYPAAITESARERLEEIAAWKRPILTAWCQKLLAL